MVNRKKYFLHEGQFLVATVPSEIMTVLGSCVSVCLWDKVLGIGGMNHYLLPGDKNDIGNASRGYSSIRMLIRSMLNRNSNIENIEAKVFGGCNSIYRENNQFRVGQRNIDIAIQCLKENGITIAVNQTGGNCGRKVVFNTLDGLVKMKFVS